MRVLFASTQGAGHFGLLIPFIDACLRGGHDALIVGPPTLKARGYPFRAGAVPPDELLGPVWGRMPSLPPGQGDVVVIGEIFARLSVDAMLPTLEAAIDEWRPDLVVRDTAEFASAVAADAAGVRHVRAAAAFAQVEEATLAFAAPALERRRRGLTERIAATPFLTLLPASVDPPPFPVTRLRAPAPEPPPPPSGWPADDERPLVYVSFGSVAATLPFGAQAYAGALAGARELPARVLLSTGGHDVELDDVPSNVRVERWVDEAAVLPHVSAVVCHGGAGTTLGALSAGRPLVVVPLFGDQPWNGVRVAAAGAGVVAPVDGVAPALELVLGDGRYAAAAARLAADMRSLPPVDGFLRPFGSGAAKSA